MIGIACSCGTSEALPESQAGKHWLCPSCGRRSFLACGETLPEGAGAGDFDASLVVTSGPSRMGERFFLGGVASIEIGKLPDKHISLQGNMVSRVHCHLQRLDFGPSRWEIHDDNSHCGTLVNGQKVTQQELKPGDAIQIGEFTLAFDAAGAQPAAVATAAMAAPAPGPLKAKGKPAKKVVAMPPAQTGGAIAYATAEQEIAERPLTECDTAWVMQIRNGARLMSYAAMPVIPAFFICALIMVISLPFSALAAGASAWFLTMKEPGVRENIFWTMILILVRVTGTATGLAIPLLMMGGWTDSPPIAVAGAISLLAMPPYLFFYLFYLRKLAARLPNPSMAVACIVVMIALPASMGMMIFGAVMDVIHKSGGMAPTGEMTANVGFWIMAASLWAYIMILFWFNRAFS